MALAALGWVLSDETHVDRLIALTGIAPEELATRLRRSEADRRDCLVAVLDFVMAHEPDLIACAEALGEKPEHFALAYEALTRVGDDTSDWGG